MCARWSPPARLLAEARQGCHEAHAPRGVVAAQIKGTDGGSPNYVRDVQTQPSRLIAAKSRLGNLPYKATFPQLIDGIVDWVEDGIAEDLNGPEPDCELGEDEIPFEGVIPVPDDGDDTPVYTETED